MSATAPAPPRSPAPAEAAAFSEALEALLRVYRIRDRDAACYGDVSANECHSLEAVERAGVLRVNDLAAELGLHKSNASRVAAGLVARGYLSRGEEAGDARAVGLRTTPAGRRLHRALRARVDAGHAALLGRYPPAVRRGVVALLEALAAQTAERFGVAGGEGRRSCS